jgi:sugar O-acyltransferase (sialic acid O-acetyltransferase NeuD family)
MNEKKPNRNHLNAHVLFGIESSFTADYVDTIARLGFAIAAGILISPPQWSLRGMPVVLHPQEITQLLLELPVLLCPTTPRRRFDMHSLARSLGFTRFASLIDPTSVVAPGIFAGRGLFINANATLAAEVELDDFVTVNRAASIGHHTVLENFATVGPGATIASHCRIGSRTMIGAGAVVAPSVSIGADATVAAGAVVFRNVEEGSTVVGNPARLARQRPDQLETPQTSDD